MLRRRHPWRASVAGLALLLGVLALARLESGPVRVHVAQAAPLCTVEVRINEGPWYAQPGETLSVPFAAIATVQQINNLLLHVSIGNTDGLAASANPADGSFMIAPSDTQPTAYSLDGTLTIMVPSGTAFGSYTISNFLAVA